MATRFRALVARPGLIVAPACFDPLTSRFVVEKQTVERPGGTID